MAGKKAIEMDDFFSQEKKPPQKQKSGIFGGMFKKKDAPPDSPISTPKTASLRSPVAESSTDALKSFKKPSPLARTADPSMPPQQQPEKPVDPNESKARALASDVKKHMSLKSPTAAAAALSGPTLADKAPPSPVSASPRASSSPAPSNMPTPNAGSSQSLGGMVAARVQSTRMPSDSPIATARKEADSITPLASPPQSPMPVPDAGSSMALGGMVANAARVKSARIPAPIDTTFSSPPSSPQPKEMRLPPAQPARPVSPRSNAAAQSPVSSLPSTPVPTTPAASLPPKPAPAADAPAKPVSPVAAAASPGTPVIISMAPRPSPTHSASASAVLPTVPLPTPDAGSAQSLAGMVAARVKSVRTANLDVEKKVAIAPWLVQDEALSTTKFVEGANADTVALKAKVAPWLAQGDAPDASTPPSPPREPSPPIPAAAAARPPTPPAKGAIDMDDFFSPKPSSARAQQSSGADDDDLGMDDEMGVANPLLDPGSSHEAEASLNASNTTPPSATKGTKWFSSLRSDRSDSIDSASSPVAPKALLVKGSPAAASSKSLKPAGAAAASAPAASKVVVSMTDYDSMFRKDDVKKKEELSVFDTDPELKDVEEFSWG